MRHVGGMILIAVLLLTSISFVSLMPCSRADRVEQTYYLHAETSVGTYFEIKLAAPEPNPSVVSSDVPIVGQYKLGSGWIQTENANYARDMSGTWTFTMYVYCDDDIITGQLYAKVFDGFSTRLNSAQNGSQPIGPCANPSSPVEVVWDDVLDHAQATSFVQGEPFRLEIWLEASSGGTTGTEQVASSETLNQGQTVEGDYVRTHAGNEGGARCEHLREAEIPCGAISTFNVSSENLVEGKSISGDFNSLSVNDGTYEKIGEDGNPNSLDWRWNVDISAGVGQYSFYLDAEIETSGNDDNFSFEYSTTGAFSGEEQPMLTVDDTWVGSFTDPPPGRYDFPPGSLDGVSTVHIRALDTNDTDWPQLKDTLRIDRMYIALTESTSNCSALDHVWAITGRPPASQHEIFLNAYGSISTDQDEFQFSYSTIGYTGPFVNLFTLTNTSDEDYYLHANVSGLPNFTTLWLRVKDTDRSPTPTPSLDDLYIDHIYLLTSGGGTPYQLHLLSDNASYQSRVRTIEGTLVDTEKPTSHALPLPPYSDTTFEIEFVAGDTGSGIHHVELWYILDGMHIQYPGMFQIPPIIFAAPGDGSYQFYTRAVDNALNYEDAPDTYDAETVIDTTPPEVVGVTPKNGGRDVSLDTEVVIRFSESMDSGYVDAAFQLVEDGGKRMWTAEDGTVVWNHPLNDTFRFRLPEGQQLKFDAKYSVILDSIARDKAGNYMEDDFRSTFRTKPEFDPSLLVLIIVIAIVITLAFLAYFLFFKKIPEEEEEKVPEAVPYKTKAAPPPGTAQKQASAPVHPPAEFGPAPAQVPPPVWESGAPPGELWKEDRSGVSACAACGRFIPIQATFCPYCGWKV